MGTKPFMTRTALVKKWETQEGANEYKTMMQKNNLSPSEDDNNYLDAVNPYAFEADNPYINQGWQQYLADTEANKNAPKYDLNSDGDDSWWEYILGWIKGEPKAIKEMNPNDEWSLGQKYRFGQLYADPVDRASAFAYAKGVNREKATMKEQNEINKIKESATSHGVAGVAHTLGAIATAPFQVFDYADDFVQTLRGQGISDNGSVSLGEYSNAVLESISDHLNVKGGTLDESIPIIGGKGWGDVYGWGARAAGSAIAGAALGSKAAEYVSHFGQGATQAMNSALKQGASDVEAVVFGLIAGAIDSLSEKYGDEFYYYYDAPLEVADYVKNAAEYIGIEGVQEAAAAVAKQIMELLVLQEKTSWLSPLVDPLNLNNKGE